MCATPCFRSTAIRRSWACATSTSTGRARPTRARWRRWRSTCSTRVSRGENPRLFGAYGGYGPGEQSRDFVHVADVADVNLWFRDRGVSGIYNCGTGRAEPFRRVAETVIASLGKGEVEFVDFPDKLKGRYQSFTQADIRGSGPPATNAIFATSRAALSTTCGMAEGMAILVAGPRWVGDMVMAHADPHSA